MFLSKVPVLSQSVSQSGSQLKSFPVNVGPIGPSMCLTCVYRTMGRGMGWWGAYGFIGKDVDHWDKWDHC